VPDYAALQYACSVLIEGAAEALELDDRLGIDEAKLAEAMAALSPQRHAAVDAGLGREDVRAARLAVAKRRA
jgi:3-hydroxyisobutyrate dehydrogenase-like beta-hydroxyacid dehydrogenase